MRVNDAVIAVLYACITCGAAHAAAIPPNNANHTASMQSFDDIVRAKNLRAIPPEAGYKAWLAQQQHMRLIKHQK